MRLAVRFKAEFDDIVSLLLERGLIEWLERGRIRIKAASQEPDVCKRTDAGAWARAACEPGRVYLMQFTPDQFKALELIAQWEGKTLPDYLAWVIRPGLELSLDDMQAMAATGRAYGFQGGSKVENQARARACLNRVQPLMGNWRAK